MSKISKQVDQQSDSDLSLQLSDASSLTSDSDLSDTHQQPVKKKTLAKKKKKLVKKPTKKPLKSNSKKKVKDDSQYCTCRRGYDGKEFMIECDGCQEWFHGACVGLKPNSIADHYFCNSCLKAKKKPASAGKTLIPPPATNKKKSIIILPISKPESKPIPTPTVPAISTLSIEDDDDDEDLDDICPVCDGDCTCGTGSTMINATVTAPPPPPPPILPEPPKIAPKIVIKKTIPASKSKKSKMPKKSMIVKDDASDSSSSDSSDSESQSESDDSSDDGVVERVGLNVKKRPIPKKKAAVTPAHAVRRGKSTTLLANIVRQKVPPHPISNKGKGKGGKKMSLISSSKLSSEEEDSDEEVVVDDLDDLLETMSPLSEHSSNESDNSLLESEEFFTDDDDEDENEGDVDIDSSSLINSPYPESRTSYSSVHIDSGDDEDIEDTETRAIIADMTLDSDEEEENESDLDNGIFVEDDEDDDDELEGNGLSINYYSGNNNWSSDEDDEEEEEFDYTTALPSDDDMNQADIDDSDEDCHNMLPLLAEGNLYDNIAVAFMNALAPVSDIQQQQQQQHNGDTTNGTETPLLGGEYHLSAFDLAHALNALSGDSTRHQELSRRPSLPSSAVSAAQRNRGSQDFNTSEALRALSALVSDDLVLSLDPILENEDMSDNGELESKETPNSSLSSPIHDLTINTDLITTPTSTTVNTPTTATTAVTNFVPNQLALSLSTDLKLQEQILDILKGSTSLDTTSDKLNNTTASNSTQTDLMKKSLLTNMYPSRQILPKPSGSGIGGSSSSLSPIHSLTLEQQIQEAIQQSIENNKRKNVALNDDSDHHKKRRISRSNSLGTTSNLQPMETTSFSTPASPAAIIDELEDMNIQIDDEEDEDVVQEEEEDAMAVSMDDLVDTSQLYTRSLSRSPSPEVEDNPYSRDLSRWQRIPIGAFRLMRSKNKLWLER